MNARIWLMLGTLTAATSARAANDTDDAVDKMNAVTLRPHLRTGRVVLNGLERSEIYPGLGFDRFDLDTSDDGESSARKWCTSTVDDMQKSRGNTDAKTGEARITQAAVEEACSNAYGHDITARLSCGFETKTEGPKGKEKSVRYAVCNGESTLTFRKYLPTISGERISFRQDGAFGGQGTVGIAMADVSSSKVGERSLLNPDPDKSSMASARSSSIGAMSRGLMRKMRDIEEFQVKAPIIAVKSGMLSNCLAKSTSRLDMPVLVVVASNGRRKEIGFAKLRQLTDGCSVSSRAGNGSRLGPSKAQLILGGSNVKAGMTLWELPTAGLNMDVGPFVQTLSMVESTSEGSGETVGASAAGVRLGTEYSLSEAGHVGISELHALASIDLGGLSGPSTGGLAAFAKLGLLKRFYVAGPLFIDASAHGGYGLVQIAENEQYRGIALGGDLGLGLQLSPRNMVRVRAGYATYGLIRYVKAADGDDDSFRAADDGASASLAGTDLGLQFLHTW